MDYIVVSHSLLLTPSFLGSVPVKPFKRFLDPCTERSGYHIQFLLHVAADR